MEVVSEEVGANTAAMAVINSEKTALGPFNFRMGLLFWPHNVQNDGHTILVVVSSYIKP